MVQFAALKFNSEKKVAIKFFMSRTAFETEQALYANANLRSILPPIEDVNNNDQGRFRDPAGRYAPLFSLINYIFSK